MIGGFSELSRKRIRMQEGTSEVPTVPVAAAVFYLPKLDRRDAAFQGFERDVVIDCDGSYACPTNPNGRDNGIATGRRGSGAASV